MSKFETLHRWIQSLPFQCSHNNKNLYSGQYIQFITLSLLQLDTTSIISQNIDKNTYLKISVMTQTLHHLALYYHTQLRIGTDHNSAEELFNTIVNVERLVKYEDQLDMTNLLKLVLGVALTGRDREEYTDDILSYCSMEDQQVIADVFQDIIENILSKKVKVSKGKRRRVETATERDFEVRDSMVDVRDDNRRLEGENQRLIGALRSVESEVMEKDKVINELNDKLIKAAHAVHIAQRFPEMKVDFDVDLSYDQDRIVEYEIVLKEKEGKIALLSESNHSLRNRIGELEKLRDVVEDLQVKANRTSDLERQLNRLSNLQEDYSKLKANFISLEKQSMEKDFQIQELTFHEKTLIPMLKEKVQKFKEENLEMYTQNKILEAQNNDLSKHIDSLEKNQLEMSQNNEFYESRVNQLEAEIYVSPAKSMPMSPGFIPLSAALVTPDSKSKLKALQAENEVLRNEVEMLKTVGPQSSIPSSENGANDLADKYLEKYLQSTEEIKSIKNSLKKKTFDFESALEKSQDLMQEIQLLKDHNSALKSEKKELLALGNQMDENYQKLSKQFEQLGKEKDIITNHNSELRELKRAVEQKYAKLQASIDQQKAEFDSILRQKEAEDQASKGQYEIVLAKRLEEQAQREQEQKEQLTAILEEERKSGNFYKAQYKKIQEKAVAFQEKAKSVIAAKESEVANLKSQLETRQPVVVASEHDESLQTRINLLDMENKFLAQLYHRTGTELNAKNTQFARPTTRTIGKSGRPRTTNGPLTDLSNNRSVV